MADGIDQEEAIKYIACALSVEITGVLHNGENFNEDRYNKNLDNLSKLPWDDE